MAIRRVQFCSLNRDSAELKKLFGFSFVTANEDLYFYDSSFKHFHLSFHKDGSTWFSDNKNKFKKLLNNPIRFNTTKKLLQTVFYFPTFHFKYPIVISSKKRYANFCFDLDSTILDKIAIECSFANFPRKITKKSNIEISGAEIFTTKDDGSKTRTVYENPALYRFEKYNMAFFLNGVNKPYKIRNLRFIFILPPNEYIELTQFKNTEIFNVNLNQIKSGGVLINTYDVSKKKIHRLVY